VWLSARTARACDVLVGVERLWEVTKDIRRIMVGLPRSRVSAEYSYRLAHPAPIPRTTSDLGYLTHRTEDKGDEKKKKKKQIPTSP
jgi:hypothetical protein